MASDIIKPIEGSGVIPENFIPLMIRTKKNDDGEKINPMKACRIVNDCTKINMSTDYPGTHIDNIEENLQKATKASYNGLNVKFDISNCYYCIPLHPDMYKYFCVDIPDICVAYFQMMPQGHTIFILPQWPNLSV